MVKFSRGERICYLIAWEADLGTRAADAQLEPRCERGRCPDPNQISRGRGQSMHNDYLKAAVIGGLAILLLLGVLWGLRYSVGGLPNELSLPILAIAGVFLLLGTLALVSVSFSFFQLDDKSQALALPEGSIRAVIALSLVVLFAILTVYLYGTLSTSGISNVKGLTTTQQRDSFVAGLKDQVIAVVPVGDQGPFTVYYRERNPASDDFAKQLLVLIGTLVTAVTSFYFGARAASSGNGAAEAPEERGISPSTTVRPAPNSPSAQTEFEISGRGLDVV